MTFYLQRLPNKASDALRINGIKDYCNFLGISLEYINEADILEFHLCASPNDLNITPLDQLRTIEWAAIGSKKLFIFHHEIINLDDISDYINEMVKSYSLYNQIIYYTYNPHDLFKKNLFNTIFINSISQTLIEVASSPSKDGSYSDFEEFFEISFSTATKYYDSFSYALKAHRHFFYSLLKQSNLVKKGIVSFNQNPHIVDWTGYNLTDPFFTNFNYLSKEYLESTLNESMFFDLTDDEDIYTATKQKFTSSTLNNSLLTITHESTCNQNDIFLTEKTVLPIASGKPFLLVSNYQSLRFLKSYFNLETFSTVFDESYDTIFDPLERTYAVFKELENFCALPFEEAKDKVLSLSPILKRNREKMINFSHKDQLMCVLNKLYLDS